MKAFIAILFSAVVVSAIPQGWGPPPPAPVIDLELSGAVALSADGSASAGQALAESASGSPAEIISINGVDAAVSQNGDVVQIAAVDLAAPATSTLQGVSGSNVAVADDYLVGQLVGDAVGVSNSAASVAEGEGAVAAAATSSNTVITKKN